MKFRALDENGDMTPAQFTSQLLTDADAVAAAIDSRMRFYYGEWWEDETLGFRVPAFLMYGLRDRNRGQTLIGYINAYILNTPGATTIASSDYSIANREFACNITVNTEYGETAEGSVTMDELLQAVS